MCEYCGCQSLPAIAELTAEHDRIVDLIGQVRVADRRGDIEDMIELCRGISAVLGPHTLVEEHGLFPAMATEFPEPIAILEAEHRRIEVVGRGEGAKDVELIRLRHEISVLRCQTPRLGSSPPTG
jgi:Hemerythrin HHE cation binding domain